MLLRISLALLLVVSQNELTPSPAWRVPVLGLAAGLAAGLFTPLAAALCALLVVAAWFRLGSAAGAVLALHAPNAIALGLLGAGAYSVDALLFGRRVLRVLP